MLVERLGQGPGSQLVFIGIAVSPSDIDEASERLKTALDESGLFSQVLNGQEEIGVESIPPLIRDRRYLLADVDLSVAGLERAFDRRLADMALLADAGMLELIAADPHLATLGIMETLAGAVPLDEGAWRSADGSVAYLVARTGAPAFDIAAQRAAVEAVRAAAIAVTGQPPELHGVGVYGVGLEQTIRDEARLRSLLACLAIALVLLVAYRRLAVLALAGLPLLLGGLAGLAAVALAFDAVHGITLAFGFTLFGVAVDYPIHLLSHLRSREERDSLAVIWPTMRLGALSTLIGYVAIAASGSRGLAQLGCFSAVGVAVALYATRSLLPDLIARFGAGAGGPAGVTVRSLPAFHHRVWPAGLAIGAALLVAQGRIWSNDLASLTPLPAETIAEDRALRQALGAPDIRFLVATGAAELEDALRASERLAALLDEAAEDGVLDGARHVTSILPSRATQEARVRRLAAIDDLRARVSAAAAGTPLDAEAFAPFVAAVRDTVEAPRWVRAQDFDGTALEDSIRNMLYFDGERWVALAMLHGLRVPARLEALLAKRAPAAALIDLKAASESLVERYRLRVLGVFGLALLAIGLLLVWRVGLSARLLWIAGTLAAALALSVALSALLLGSLSLFNLIAVVLVAGLGFDYALFFSRTERRRESLRDTRHAVLVCAASTLAAFGVLAFSSVPILRGIGVSVSLGVALSYVLARFGFRQRRL